MSGAHRPSRTPEVREPSTPCAQDACGSRGPAAASGRSGIMKPSHPTRRSSSGYFSNESDSVPSSPQQRTLTADALSQTVSPSAQTIEHALSRLQALEPSDRARPRQPGISGSSSRPADSARDMQAVQIGQAIRKHGDEFNQKFAQRAQARAAAQPPPWWPEGPQEPVVVICVGLLIFLFGRLLLSRPTSYRDPQV
ncbi:unnamed protein product [Knipowitschia caucasica]|uniref:Uncharacterized protein n=1 Tax=Knipowitschia caucasica TaxID=637954 RepID=A0AAV2JP02_KNICA